MEHRWHKVWPVWVPKTLEITKPTSEYFRDWADLTPDRVALSFYGRDIRYAELNRLIDKTAWALVGLGVKPGDRVAIHMENCPPIRDRLFWHSAGRGRRCGSQSHVQRRGTGIRTERRRH